MRYTPTVQPTNIHSSGPIKRNEDKWTENSASINLNLACMNNFLIATNLIR